MGFLLDDDEKREVEEIVEDFFKERKWDFNPDIIINWASEEIEEADETSYINISFPIDRIKDEYENNPRKSRYQDEEYDNVDDYFIDVVIRELTDEISSQVARCSEYQDTHADAGYWGMDFIFE